MPWPPRQLRAILARMHEQGKSEEEIRAFLHKHGYTGKKKPNSKG